MALNALVDSFLPQSEKCGTVRVKETNELSWLHTCNNVSITVSSSVVGMSRYFTLVLQTVRNFLHKPQTTSTKQN